MSNRTLHKIVYSSTGKQRKRHRNIDVLGYSETIYPTLYFLDEKTQIFRVLSDLPKVTLKSRFLESLVFGTPSVTGNF